MTDWASFIQGMESARSTGMPGHQATSFEAKSLGGPDFIFEEKTDRQRDWHRGYDYAVLLARAGK